MKRSKVSYIEYGASIFLLLFAIVCIPVSASLNPTIEITDHTGLAYDSISFPVNDPLIFSGKVNPGPGENVAVWRWEIDDGMSIIVNNSQNFDYTFTVPGDYQVTLYVTDSTGFFPPETASPIVLHITNEMGLFADFTYALDASPTPSNITLIDQSQCTTADGDIIEDWYWIMDGELYSQNQLPFMVPLPGPASYGTHEVGLRIDTNLGKKAYIEKVVHIPPELVDYNVVLDIGADNGGEAMTAPLTVQYHAEARINDLSVAESAPRITHYEWVSWDLTDQRNNFYYDAIIDNQSPVITYEKPGIYYPYVLCHVEDPLSGEIVRIIKDFNGIAPSWFNSDGISFTVGPEIKADFYWDTYPEDPNGGHLVQFKDISTSIINPIEQWTWDFGDGNITPIHAPDNPSIMHRFKEPGTYPVMLIVDNYTVTPPIEDFVVHNVVINKGYLPNPIIGTYGSIIPSFTTTGGRTGTSPLTVQFLDQSTGGPNNWLWNFGDGTMSVEKNPMHQFISEVPKTFNVTLTVSNGATTNKTTETGYISIT